MKKCLGIIVIIIAAAAAGWFFFGGTDQVAAPDQATDKTKQQLHVVTSIYPLQYITERIVGEAARVTNIGAGRDPHDFRPSAQDIKTMQDADLVILQGAKLEPWGKEIHDQLERAGVAVLVATDNLELYEMAEHDEHGDEDEHHDDHADEHHDDHEDEGHDADEHHDDHDDHDGHDHGSHDPHTWLDPVLISQMAGDINSRLVKIDPANSDHYAANLQSLQQDLIQLDADYSQALSDCSLDEVIASHDAFGYIGRRYGFEIHAIGGLSTQDIPSAVTMTKLKQEAAEGIAAILLEQNSVAAYGETLARETGLLTLPINPIVIDIPAGKEYLDVMRDNLATFKTALNCHD